jgi:uncharacterized Fe-S cluster protein YjdI
MHEWDANPTAGESVSDPSTPGRVPADPTREYHAEGITVQWHAGRCLHSGNCVRALRRVFDPQRRPWIDMTAASADEIAAAVRQCPSGALGFTRHDARDSDPGDDT